MVGFLAAIAALVAVALAVDLPALPLWSIIGLTSVTAIVIGVRHHRPRRTAPWWLLAGALLALTAGDTAYLVLEEILELEPFPSVDDIVYLAGFFPLAIAGVVSLARSGARAADRASLLDALIITSGVALLSWTFLIEPWLTAPSANTQETVIAVAYPVAGMLIVITLARLAAAVRWTASVAALVLGGCGMVIADTVYGVGQMEGGWTVTSGTVDAGWFVLYACWGLAALHPSMRSLTEPRVVFTGELNPRRLRVLSVGALTAVVALVVGVAGGRPVDITIAVLLTSAMLALVLMRLSAAVGVQRRGLARERGLRLAGSALVAATSEDEVVAAVRAAVAQLLPPDTPHGVALVRQPPPEQPAGDDRPGHVPRPRPSGNAAFVYVETLPTEVARHLAHAGVALRCELSVAGRSRLGTLYIGAHETVLATLPAAAVVLASQAAMALERIRLTEAINQHASEEYFRTLVHNAADVILIVNADDTIRYASPSAATVLGADQLAGRAVQTLVSRADRAAVDRVLQRLREGPAYGTDTADWTVVTGSGGQLQVEARGRDLRTDSTVAGLVITLRDVTQQRRLERELTHRAFHDALTGLANRDLLSERVEQALACSAEHGTVVGVLFLDLDDLKLVNDTMGHAAGDELLVAASQRLTAMLRSSDTAARLGGDEFAALIHDAHAPQEVEQTAARVVAAFDEPFLVAGQLVSGAVSVGVATTAEARDASELLRHADLALYLAKNAGKAQWRRYEAARHDQVLRRMELRGALTRAVSEEAFRLDYQPIVALDSGATVGMEALLRWEHPHRGAVGPGEFIAEAEENGLIVPIGNWVLTRSLTDAATWACDGPADGAPYLSVNVSARQLRQPGFLTAVRTALDAAGLAPQCLVVEITERVLLRDDEQVWADLAALRKLGVRVAIDDFGTGYSSLSYLRQAPIDMVKIERSFLDTMASSTSQLAVVDGIVRLAHTLGLAVVAEGIESAQDRDLLLDVGCQFGQGYLFARPMSSGDALDWLQAAGAAA